MSEIHMISINRKKELQGHSSKGTSEIEKSGELRYNEGKATYTESD